VRQAHGPGAGSTTVPVLPGEASKAIASQGRLAPSSSCSVRLITKQVSLAIDQVQVRRLWQPPQHNLGDGPLWREHGIPLTKEGKPWDVIDTARFAAYASIGWTVAELAPRLFARLGW
jgi:hypothetical protein